MATCSSSWRDGRKMSKRLGNLVNPWEMIERFGADAVRVFLLASSQVGLQKRFDPNAIREVALEDVHAAIAAGGDEDGEEGGAQHGGQPSREHRGPRAGASGIG